LDVPTVVAEFYRGAERHGQPPENLIPRRVYRYEISLAAALDLRESVALATVGLTEGDIQGDDLSACQAVGEAAHYLAMEGIVAPSAAGPGEIVAVFYSRLRMGSAMRDVDFVEWTSLPSRS
jgi:RES domain-containing protein